MSLLCSLLLASHLTIAQQFTPRGDLEQRYGTRLQRRIACEPATPDVSEDAVFTDACNENPQNSFSDCFNTLVLYAQDSATETCAHFYTLYNDCLVANNYSETACADSRSGYVYCSNYTIQAYAYCGCYFALPDQLYSCASVELQVNAGHSFTASAPTSSSTLLTSAILTGPVVPQSATLSSIPQTSDDVPLVSYSPRQSTTLLTSTPAAGATTVVTSGSGIPYTGLVLLPSSSPPIMTAAAAQSTTTLLSTIPVTRTATITTCPAPPCPAGGYSSESVYTTSVVSTVLSCEGGCDGGPERAGVCVVRRRSKVLARGRGEL
ncbi:MAG: hypothetical protein LQ338_002283 [Usnochroma carphineum]|nr:MAG: hypothetical protein LQ338_002283 [Usnochroma carphineum]